MKANTKISCHDFFVNYLSKQIDEYPKFWGRVEKKDIALYTERYILLSVNLSVLYDNFHKIPFNDRIKNKKQLVQLIADTLLICLELALLGGLSPADIANVNDNLYYIERDLLEKDNIVIANNLFMSLHLFGLTLTNTEDIQKFQTRLKIATNFLINSVVQFDISADDLEKAFVTSPWVKLFLDK